MRRRRSALAALVAVAWLTGPALAQTDTQRRPANDPATVRANALFTIHSRLVSAEPDFEAQETRALGGQEQRDRQLAEIQRLDADALARRYVRSLEGLLSMSLMVDVMRGVYTDPVVFQQRMEAARKTIRRADGTTVTLPVLLAATYYRGDLRLVARTLQARKPARAVAGAYTVALKGADCPFPAGPIQLVQQGSVIEGARDGRLALWGVLGAKQAAFLATEQRFVVATRSAQGVAIDVPDRPLEIYAAPLGARALVLAGTGRETCTMTLARHSSAVQ